MKAHELPRGDKNRCGNGFEAESVYYYDREAEVVSYLGLTSNGYVSWAQTAFDGDVFTQSAEQTGPDSPAYAIRVTFRVRETASW